MNPVAGDALRATATRATVIHDDVTREREGAIGVVDISCSYPPLPGVVPMADRSGHAVLVEIVGGTTRKNDVVMMDLSRRRRVTARVHVAGYAGNFRRKF